MSVCAARRLCSGARLAAVLLVEHRRHSRLARVSADCAPAAVQGVSSIDSSLPSLDSDMAAACAPLMSREGSLTVDDHLGAYSHGAYDAEPPDSGHLYDGVRRLAPPHRPVSIAHSMGGLDCY